MTGRELQMESEMLGMTAVVKQMQLRLSEQRDRLKACGVELDKKEQTIRDVNRIVKNIQVDIHSASEHYQNSAKLKDAVKVSRRIRIFSPVCVRSIGNLYVCHARMSACNQIK